MPLASLLGTCPTFPHFPGFPQVDCALSGAGSQVGELVYVLGPPGSLQGLFCEAGSFLTLHNPHWFLQPEFLRLYFPTLEPWVGQFVSLPSCSLSLSVFKCATPGPPAAALPHVLSAQLSISTPPTGLDKCFFFNSLVVGLPCRLIFWQFWLFFLF